MSTGKPEQDRPRCEPLIQNQQNSNYHPRESCYSNSRSISENASDILNHLNAISISQLLKEANDPKSHLRRFFASHSRCTDKQLVELFSIFRKVAGNETSPEMTSRFFVELLASSFVRVNLLHFLSSNFVEAAKTINDYPIFMENLLEVLIHCFIRCSALSHQYLLPVVLILETNLEDLNSCSPYLLTANLKERLKRLSDLKQAASIQRVTTGEATKLSQKDKYFLKQDAALPPEDYRHLSVFPTTEDIQKDRKDIFLRRNIVRGVYDSVDTYLDIHFRLMREDFVDPLRSGIQQYLKVTTHSRRNPNHGGPRTQERLELRVYTKVQVKKSFPSRECGMVHDLTFATDTLKRVVWEKTKRLSYGFLVCLTADDFRTMFFGMIVLRDVKDLKKGTVTVKFLEGTPPRTGNYVMVESSVFFEAYRHILVRLKELDTQNFPMPDLLLGKFMALDVKPSLPLYLRSGATIHFDLSIFVPRPVIIKRGGEHKFYVSPLVKNEWPHNDDLNMDESQFKAFKHALTRELCIIQGPPGCGKTYVALKIVQALLKVCSASKLGPILIVCFTNHALDQFLEGMLPFCPKGIVRVGRQSKSQKLEGCNINVLRKTRVRNFSRGSKFLLKDLVNVEEQMERHRNRMAKAHMVILSQNDLGSIIPVNLREQLVKCSCSPSKALTNWLLGINRAADESTTNLPEIAASDVLECLLLETIVSNAEIILEELDFNLDEMDKELAAVDDGLEEEVRDIFEVQKKVAKARNKTKQNSQLLHPVYLDFGKATGWCTPSSARSLSNMIRHRLHGPLMNEDDVSFVNDVTSLGINDRWRLYNYWRSQYVIIGEDHPQKLVEEYERLVLQYQELKQLDDMEIFRNSAIIGMTTTAAARYGRILCELQPRIVIVEEAAEVLESHIVTSLSQGTQHLILIGDHKQLQPSNAVYRLAKDYHLDISLFERLIECKYPFDTLSLQHRMRPEISVLMKHIYENLGNHPCVEKYEHIRGMKKDVFLMNHSNQENFHAECSSYSNDFEAHLISKLCRYLLLNGYEASQITVLTLYTGQLFTIQRHMPKKDFNGVHITTVDNFQGEENDIILLSLVRSNNNDKIGFLYKENRICVALSRAKMGLYVIGNFDMLARQSSLWQKVVDDMSALDCCGDVLQLSCQMHPNDPPIDIRVADDFLKAPEGGCSKICNDRLICGHACRRVCHPMDREHKEYKCLQPCVKSCSKNNHPCKRSCYQDCGNCLVKVPVVLPICGHEQYAECYKEIDEVKCVHPCNRSCSMDNHPCKKLCHENCGNCMEFVSISLPLCGHQQYIECYRRFDDVQCIHVCGAPCRKNNHPCKKLCSDKCGDCMEMVPVVLSRCGHTQYAECYKHQFEVKCLHPCQKLLSKCQHPCNAKCSEPCTTKCQVKVEITLPYCGHTISMECHSTHSDLWSVSCPKSCGMDLGCGHQCKGTCGSCGNGRLHQPCLKETKQSLVCGHELVTKCFEKSTSACKIVCPDQCSHGTCKHFCNEPCESCKKPCPIQCEHRKCNKLCFETCNIDPCNEPCPKFFCCSRCQQIAPCIGLCGEVCPKKCQQCDQRELCDAWFETKEEPNARYILLPKCRHLVEVKWMDKYMKKLCEVGTSRFILCPRCQCPISLSCTQRYIDQIKSCQNLRNMTIAKELDTQKLSPWSLYRDWIFYERELYNLHAGLSMLDAYCVCSSIQSSLKEKSISDRMLLHHESVLNYLKQISAIYKTFDVSLKTKGSIVKSKPNDLHQHLKRSFILLINFVLEKNRRFDILARNDFQMEMNRLTCLVHYFKLICDKSEALDELKNEINTLLYITSHCESRISNEKKVLIMDRLEEFSKKYHSAHLGVPQSNGSGLFGWRRFLRMKDPN